MHVELSLKNLPVYALIGKELQMKSMQREVREKMVRIIREVYTYTHTRPRATAYKRQNNGLEGNMVHRKQQTSHLQSPHGLPFPCRIT
jgi:hypothetical protein